MERGKEPAVERFNQVMATVEKQLRKTESKRERLRSISAGTGERVQSRSTDRQERRIIEMMEEEDRLGEKVLILAQEACRASREAQALQDPECHAVVMLRGLGRWKAARIAELLGVSRSRVYEIISRTGLKMQETREENGDGEC
jgi:DNA-directed RNA polymerase specialized sigma24 family protein